MDQKKWNTQEFQMTIVDSKIYGNICAWRNMTFFSFQMSFFFSVQRLRSWIYVHI